MIVLVFIVISFTVLLLSLPQSLDLGSLDTHPLSCLFYENTLQGIYNASRAKYFG